MDSIHRIAKAASNRWLWLRHCWNLRSEVAKLAAEVDGLKECVARTKMDSAALLSLERDAKHLMEIEVKELKEKLRVQADTFQVAKDGNQALLRFIHTRHRLNVKFDPDTIRGVLQRADQKRINGQ